MPSLYEGFSLPAIEAMSLRRPAGGHHRRRAARGRRRRRRDRLARAARRQRGAGRHASADALDDPELRATRRRRRPPAGDRPLELAPHRRADGRAVPGAASPSTGDRGADRADRRLRPARPRARRPRCSTWAPAPAATRSRRFRRGARVVALDYDAAELKDVAGAVRRPCDEAGEAPAGRGGRRASTATAPGLPFPDDTLRPHHRSEVLEHIPDDDGRHRRAGPGAQARRHDRRHRAGLAPRAGLLGAVRRVPRPVRRRAATSASTPRPSCARQLRGAGLRPGGAHHAHALHSPYWWLQVRGRARPTTTTRWCRRTTGCWCGTSRRRPRLTRWTEQAAEPGARQEPRRLRHASPARPRCGVAA